MTDKLSPAAAAARVDEVNAKRNAIAVYIVRSLHILTQMAGEGISIEGTPEPDIAVMDMWRAFGEPDDEAEDGHPVAVEVLNFMGLQMPHPNEVMKIPD